MSEQNIAVLSGIKNTSEVCGLSEELLLLARDKIRKLNAEGVADLPIGLEGFDASGRVYWTEKLKTWLTDNAAQLELDYAGDTQYWHTIYKKYQALNSQLEHEERKNKLCLTSEIAVLLKRIFSAQSSLLNDRFLQDLPVRASLTPEQVKRVEECVDEVLKVMREEGLNKWTK